MEVNKDTRLKDILAEYPWLKEELIKQTEKAKLLDTPFGRMFIKKATVQDLSKKTGKSPEQLIQMLNQLLDEHSAG